MRITWTKKKVEMVVLAALVLGNLVSWGFVGSIPYKLRAFVEELEDFVFGNWPPPLGYGLLALGLLAALALWKIPQWQVAALKDLTTDKDRFESRNEARKTLAQIIGGGLLLYGLYSSVQTFDLSRQGQITDRFSKAIEQLGALDEKGRPKVEVRLGAIYALGRIAKDSERDHWPIMQVLAAYVRERSPRKSHVMAVTAKPAKGSMLESIESHGGLLRPEEEPPIPEDIQAVVAVLTDRVEEYDRGALNLSDTDLHGAKLTQWGSTGTHGVLLAVADLHGADLRQANLAGAKLHNADLSGADLRGAILTGANLVLAHLQEADLRKATFFGTNIDSADLRGADLRGADLGLVQNLTQAQLKATHYDSTTLLPVTRLPRYPPKSDSMR